MLRQALHGVINFLLRKVAIKFVAAPVRRRLAAFEAMTQDPMRVQRALLKDILSEQANTAFGKDYSFSTIKDFNDYRRQLPVRGYDAIDPYITRVRKGETNALLSDPKVYMFAMTSGTTATRKYIPVTNRYLADYRRSWNIWGLKVFTDHREITLKPILQMAGDADEFRTEAGIPCGAVTGLTASMQKRIVRWMYCVPASVARIKDSEAKYYTVMRLSLPRDVGLLVAANPSTMLNLARACDRHKESLIKDIHDGTLSEAFAVGPEIRTTLKSRLRADPKRAKELQAIVERTDHLYPKDAWSGSFLLGNWTGGSVGAYLHHYPKYFGENWVRDVGLIASEGRMTIPFDDGTPAGVLDISSHYFEFIPETEIDSPQPTVLEAHELQEGHRYFILLTTGYGLYRYHIHDLVRVAGFHNKTPLLEFLSKGSHFANLTGEKISEYHVTHAMKRIVEELNLDLSTYSLAPCWPEEEGETPWYGLFVEPSNLTPHLMDEIARRLESGLCELNIEYEAKRASNRLKPIRVERVPPGFWLEWDRARLKKTGGTLEQYKHPCLINDLGFYRQVPK